MCKLLGVDGFQQQLDPFLNVLGSRRCNFPGIDAHTSNICVLGLRSYPLSQCCVLLNAPLPCCWSQASIPHLYARFPDPSVLNT